MEHYLYNLNFYVKDLDIKEGEIATDDCYDYMSISPIDTTDKKLVKCVKSIELMPYFIKFKDEYDKIQEYSIKGKVTVYKS